ncbi:hypothetical protein N7470_010138 [Penicillium chermesinum]|nr:hypothetical protein N7470_010138 [Penicillium chermesinum]
MLRTRKVKKEGRKRTSSTASHAPQAGPVEASKSSPPKQDPRPQVKPPTPRPPQNQSPTPTLNRRRENPPLIQPSRRSSPPKPRSNPVSPSLLASKANAQKSPTSSTSISRNSSGSRPPVPSAPSPPPRKQMQISRKQQKPSAKSLTAPSPPPDEFQLQITRPESYYASKETALHRQPLPPSPPSSPEDSIHRGIPTRRRDSSASEVLSGYGLVASYLTRSSAEEKGSFPPLYRRFESVNHRVLLHLQDEISQMEEDLQALDEYEEMHRVAAAEKEGSKVVPASRRVEAQTQAYSTLHYRRMELMAALTQKTEQYNNALSSYSKVIQTLPRASEDDISNYRSWMKQRNPIAASETRFLRPRLRSCVSHPAPRLIGGLRPVYMSTFIAAGAILMPLLAFSLIAEFAGRLVVVTVIGGAAAAIAANYSAGIDTLIDSRDGWKCASVYFGFMTIAALFIP